MADTAVPVTASPTGSTPAPSAAPATVATPSGPQAVGSPAAAAVSAPAASMARSSPPEDRWPSILDNARAKTRAEVEQEFRQKYSRYDQFETDPLAAVLGWLDQGSQHSIYGPHIANWAEQYVGKRHGQAPEEPKPDVPIMDQAGNVTGYTYSDRQLQAREKWLTHQLNQQWEERLGPLEQREAARQERDQQTEVMQNANQHASHTLASLRSQPYFKEHEVRIREAFEQHPEWGDNIHAAYNHVLINEILPNLSQAEQRRTITELQTKAGGNTVNPGSPVTPPRSFKKNDFRSALEYFDTHPDEAERFARR